MDARHKNLISRTLWIGQQKLFFVFLVVNKLLYWLRAPHAMPPSITFLVLFGIKYGDWLVEGQQAGADVFTKLLSQCHEYYYYLIPAKPHHYWFGFNVSAGFLWADSIRLDRDFIFSTHLGYISVDKELLHHCWSRFQTAPDNRHQTVNRSGRDPGICSFYSLKTNRSPIPSGFLIFELKISPKSLLPPIRQHFWHLHKISFSKFEANQFWQTTNVCGKIRKIGVNFARAPLVQETSIVE